VESAGAGARQNIYLKNSSKNAYLQVCIGISRFWENATADTLQCCRRNGTLETKKPILYFGSGQKPSSGCYPSTAHRRVHVSGSHFR